MSGTVAPPPPSPPPNAGSTPEWWRGWLTRHNLPSWIAAIATGALAGVAYVEFPPLKRIGELEMRETTLSNRADELKREADAAERRKAEAEQQSNAAFAQVAGLKSEIDELERGLNDLRTLVDLLRSNGNQLAETLKEREEDIQEARNRLERAEAEARDAQEAFRRYVVKVTLIRVRGRALNFALEASAHSYDALREISEHELSEATWPLEVWGSFKDKYSVGVPDQALLWEDLSDPIFTEPGIYWSLWDKVGRNYQLLPGYTTFPKGNDWKDLKSFNWGPIEVTGAQLVRTALISVEFRELPKLERSLISRQIKEFVDARRATFGANLLLGIEFSDLRKLAEEPEGTTGDEDLDRKIVAELQRHEAVHRELAAALKELEALLLSETAPAGTAE